MICALSGEPVKDPVVSPRSGAVFERNLIETYIASSGKDPINDEPLETLELIALAVPAAIMPPRAPSFSSIPTMLAAFQNEWDALALETYTLRKQLHDSRNELSAALYKYEAAVRVAARVTKERDAAQVALTKLTEALAVDGSTIIDTTSVRDMIGANGTNGSSTTNRGDAKNASNVADEVNSAKNNDFSESVSVDDMNITMPESKQFVSDVRNVPVDRLLQAREKLFGIHKKMKISLPITKSTTVTIEERNTTSNELSGLREVAIDSTSKKSLFLGSFGAKLLPDEITATDALTGAFLTNDGSSTAIVLANGHLKLLEQNVLQDFAVTESKFLATHPSEPLFVVATEDNHWVLADTSGPIYSSGELQPITSMAIHVDGILLALGRAGAVDIFDLTSTQRVSTIEVGKGTVTDIQFALNGYWIVITSENDKKEGSIDVYDLRKSVVTHTFAYSEPVQCCLDPSSLVLLSYQKIEKKLSAHLYSKKSKSWLESCGALKTEELLLFACESSPEEVQQKKALAVVGFTAEKTIHYSVALSS